MFSLADHFPSMILLNHIDLLRRYNVLPGIIY